MLLLMVPKTLHHPWIRRKPDGYHQQYLVHCAKSFCKVRLNLLLEEDSGFQSHPLNRNVEIIR